MGERITFQLYQMVSTRQGTEWQVVGEVNVPDDGRHYESAERQLRNTAFYLSKKTDGGFFRIARLLEDGTVHFVESMPAFSTYVENGRVLEGGLSLPAKKIPGVMEAVLFLILVGLTIYAAYEFSHLGSGRPINWWLIWDIACMLAAVVVSIRVRGCAGVIVVWMVLAIMLTPYLNEVKDLPSVRDAWNPNPATYQPEDWECDIQLMKHAIQQYPIDPMYRSCFH